MCVVLCCLLRLVAYLMALFWLWLDGLYAKLVRSVM